MVMSGLRPPRNRDRDRLTTGAHAVRDLAPRVVAWFLMALWLGMGWPAGAEEPPPERALTADVVQGLLRDTVIELDPDAAEQWLPETVREVRTGPDGRQWYALHPAGWTPEAVGEADVEAIKRTVEGQFAEPAPKVPGVRLALFEPDGRVWFIVEPGELLLGYAGVPGEWIERRAEGQHNRFSGSCNGDANPPGGAANAVSGKHRIFIDRNGVQVFDGEAWSHHAFLDPPNRTSVLTVHHDPGGGIIYATVAFRNAERQKHQIWRFHYGEWTPLPNPRLDEADDLRLAAGVAGGRVLVYGVNNGIQFIDIPGGYGLDAPEPPPSRLPPGPTIDLNDPKVQRRTDAVALTPDGTVVLAGARLDPDDGTFGLIALERGRPLSEAPLVMNDEAITGPNFLVGIFSSAEWIGPSRLYLSGRSPVAWSGVLHLSAGPARFSALPGPRPVGMMTSTASGRVFVGGTTDIHWPNQPIAVRCADPPVGAGRAAAGTGTVHALAPDGSLWAGLEDGGLTRFDGSRWEPQPIDLPPDQTRVTPVIAGTEGVMLLTVWGRNQDANADLHALLHRGVVSLDNDPLFLVADHADVVRRAFAHLRKISLAYRGGRGLLGVLIDPAGRVWLAQPSNGLDVLVDGEWHRAFDGEVDGLFALGDGNDMILFPDNGQPQRVRWNDGEFKMDPLIAGPEDDTKVRVDHARRVPDGAVWIGYSKFERRPQGGWRYHVLRVEPDGERQTLKNVGWPRLIEADGTVWLGGVGGYTGDGRGDRFGIWRDGRIVQELRVPGADSTTRFFTVTPGSVWAWTEYGLRHLVADEAATPGHYGIHRKVFPTEDGDAVNINVSSAGDLLTVSPLGFLAAIEERWGLPRRLDHRLVIFHLFERADAPAEPAPDAAPNHAADP